MTPSGSLLTPDPAVPGNLWPVIPAQAPSRMLSLLFQLEQSQWLSAKEIQAQQSRQLGALLRHAWSTSSFYRRRLEEAGLSLDAIRTPDDWRKIPLLTREDWQNAGIEIYSNATPPEHGNMSQLFTSGSTGKPVMVVTTGLTQLLWNAFTARDHLWHRRDFRTKLAAIRFVSGDACDPPDGRIGQSWGPATAGITRTGPSATLHIKAGIDQQIPWLVKQDPEYLITYPSNVLALARKCEQRGIKLPSLREVRTFGEILEPHTREAVRRAFGVKTVDMYSSQEVGYIALQCPDHEHYHVQSENVLVEVLREDGTPCEVGEIGRIAVTAYHVVRDFQKLEVRTSDGSLLPASLVVAEEDIDIALVKVSSSRPLEAASPAAAKRITEGRRAMVVGNPMGMGQSVIRGRLGTVRVVTWDGNKAPLRAIEADVVPGNSGGGAFDIETGELLGITVAKSSTMEGTGYMVPADQLGHLLRDSWPITSWIESREVHSALGAMLRPVRLTEGSFEHGLLVTHVDEASPADLAGWHVGDVLVGLDRYRTEGIDDVLYVLDQSSPLDRSPLGFVLARDNARSVGVVDFGPTAGSPMLAQKSLLAPMR